MRLTKAFEKKKYFIVEDNRLKSVTQGIYENWLENKSDHFILPTLIIEKKNKIHTIDFDFAGVMDKNEIPHPFVLFHFENEINKNGMKTLVKEMVEHFENFAELKKRREKLIKTISKN
jgi:hypothetical protein